MMRATLAKGSKSKIAIGIILILGLVVFSNNSRGRIAKGDIAQLSAACTYLSIARYSINYIAVDGELYEHLADGVREIEAFSQSHPQYEFLYASADEALSAIAPQMPDFEPNDPRYSVAVTDLFNSKTHELDKASSQCQSVLTKVSGTPTTVADYSTYDPFWNSNG